MATVEEPLPLEISDEPLIGWRCWHVLPHEGLLRPIYKRGLVWAPRQPHHAICPESPHEVPGEDCKCGVWTVCHPMLLNEIGWRTMPPSGVSRLPGVLVVGEVSLWGKIVQHERGWRAGVAYPRHLYVFIDDAMIAETLRERYGVPVAWGAEAERLRRVLPVQDADEEPQPTLRGTLLDVFHSGPCPKALKELVTSALDAYADDYRRSPEDRIEQARAELAKPLGPDARRAARRRRITAAADLRALQGDQIAARRILWVRLVQWQLHRGHRVLAEAQPWLRQREEVLEDLRRGTSHHGRRVGQPYAAGTLAAKRSGLRILEQWITEAAARVEKLVAVPIPSYKEWCGIAGSPRPAPAAEAWPSEEHLRAWYRHVGQREQDLARRAREAALERHQLIADRQASEERQRIAAAQLAEDRAELERQRATLRDDVIAGIERDRGELLQEVGELERRRRAALAMLPGPWPPATRKPRRRVRAAVRPKPRACAAGQLEVEARRVERAATAQLTRRVARGLRRRLLTAGISQARVARAAGVGISGVNDVFAGRSVSLDIVAAAERLLKKQGRA